MVAQPAHRKRPGANSFASIVAFCLAACLSASPAQGSRTVFKPVRTSLAFPETGSVQIAGLDDEMLRQGHYTRQSGLLLAQSTELGPFIANAGFYPLISEDGDYGYHAFRREPSSDDMGYLTPVGSALAAWGKGPSALRVSKDRHEICLISSRSTVISCNRKARYRPLIEHRLTDRDLPKKLIYEGRQGNRLQLRYWEKSGHYARPEHVERLNFDLGKSQEIAFRGGAHPRAGRE